MYNEEMMKKPPIYTIYMAVMCFILTILSCIPAILLLHAHYYIVSLMLALFGSIAFVLGTALLISGLKRRKNRVLGIYGERKIMVEYMGSIIEVYNFSAALSSVNYITLIINNIVADRFGGIANSILKGKIQTPDGEKCIILKSNNIVGTLKLYCEDVLLSKKLIFFG